MSIFLPLKLHGTSTEGSRMGLFDSISNLFNSDAGANASQLAEPLMSELQQNGIDGVGGLASQFEQSDFGSHFASWVGNGQNLPINPDAIQQVLGQPVVANLAAKLGIDPQQASSLLAQHLPSIIDHLTPNGQVQP
jgi:uncharacterized protein YidB (DUF937 family)